MDEQLRERLAELDITLPTVSTPSHNYVTSTRADNIVFMAGKTPTPDFDHKGLLGRDVALEDGYQAARSAAIHTLAQIEADHGLDRVARILKLNGYVASADGFNEQPGVINGASDIFTEVLGATGEHARTAIGVAQLPGRWPVEIEVVILLKGSTDAS